MRIVLHESPHTRKTRQSTARFVAVDDTKLSHSDWKLLVAPVAGVENQTVSRTVHRLEGPLLLLDIQGKHVVLVILPVSRSLPKFAVVHVGRDDLGRTLAIFAREAIRQRTFLVSSLEIFGLGSISKATRQKRR